jgi:mlo protein
MLLGVISLLLSQTAHFISEICVPSSLFTSRFYICSEKDYDDLLRNTDANQTALGKSMFGGQRLHVCSEVNQMSCSQPIEVAGTGSGERCSLIARVGV